MTSSKPKQTKNEEVAKRVVTPKRRYFVAGQPAVEAAGLDAVNEELKKRSAQEDGDGNK